MALISLWVISLASAQAAVLTIPNIFVANTPILSAAMNVNFAAVASVVNSLDNNNIAFGANIAISKINFASFTNSTFLNLLAAGSSQYGLGVTGDTNPRIGFYTTAGGVGGVQAGVGGSTAPAAAICYSTTGYNGGPGWFLATPAVSPTYTSLALANLFVAGNASGINSADGLGSIIIGGGGTGDTVTISGTSKTGTGNNHRSPVVQFLASSGTALVPGFASTPNALGMVYVTSGGIAGATGISSTAVVSANQFNQPFLNNTSGSSIPAANNLPLFSGGRLSLSSSLPVTVSDITGATTIYYLPYSTTSAPGMISVCDSSGSNWGNSAFTTLSIAVPSTTNTNYDVFYNDSTGSAAQLVLTAWSSQTARATGLTQISPGVWVQNGQDNYRYLGTFATGSVSGQVADSAANRNVWNMNNRIPRQLYAADTTTSWGYTTATWRSADANTTAGQGRTTFIIGLQETMLDAEYHGGFQNTASTSASVAIGLGLDATGAATSQCSGSVGGTINKEYNLMCRYNTYPAVGIHFLQNLEFGVASNVFFGQITNTSAGQESYQMGCLNGM